MTVDLTTQYLGLQLKNPLIASACPLTASLDTLCELEQAGVSAAVLPSLFEETIEHEEAELARLFEYQSEMSAESLNYLPEMRSYNVGGAHYLQHLRGAKQAVQIPVIASLNGVSAGGWIRYAREVEEAGADAVELNAFYVPTDPQVNPLDIEKRYVDLVASVRDTISIPLAVKIGPFFSNIAYTANSLVEAGADGLVLFNRYLEPDIDLENLSVEPKLVLSSHHEARLTLRWIAILHGKVNASLAATAGVHTHEDAIKAMLAGADVAMIASVLLQHGPARATTLLNDMKRWLSQKGYESIRQLKGSMSRQNCPDASALERANYTKALTSYTRYI